ncbi:MAG: hypothetical protein K6E78_00170 [Treponema sp.]|nr:hypothetical protein [Treponema sp.]
MKKIKISPLIFMLTAVFTASFFTSVLLSSCATTRNQGGKESEKGIKKEKGESLYQEFLTLECLGKEECSFKEIKCAYQAENEKSPKKNDRKDKAIFLSPEEIEKDTEEFIYLLESCYAGYKKACQKGFSPERLREKIKNRFCNRKEVLQDEVAWTIWKETFPYIKDMHFVIESQKSYYQFSPHLIPYFSDTYVKKEGDEYLVSLTDSSELEIGDLYSGQKENLFYYPSRGLDLYRVGCLLDPMEIEKARQKAEKEKAGENESAAKNNTADQKETASGPLAAGQKKTASINKADSRNDAEGKSLLLESSFNGKKIRLSVRDYGCLDIPEKLDYKESQTEKSAYIYISNFMAAEAESRDRKQSDKLYKNYADAAKKYLKKQNIILDLRGNQGGNMNYSLIFPINLYLGEDSSFYKGKNFSAGDMADFFIRLFYKDCFLLESPGIVQNTLEYLNLYFPEMEETIDFLNKRYRVLKEKPEVSLWPMNEYASTSSKIHFSIPKESAFKGRLFFITDRNSFSAAEDIISFSRQLFKNQAEVYVIGENTAGCMEYGGLLSYQLSCSEIRVNLCQSAFYPFEEKVDSWKGEGLGHFPDAWASPEDIRSTLELLLN